MTKSKDYVTPDSQKHIAIPKETIVAIGEHLKQARFKSGLSLAEVAAKLKLSEKKIAEIEAGLFEVSNLSYTRAMLRGYAKVLHANIDKQLAALAPAEEPTQAETTTPFSRMPDVKASAAPAILPTSTRKILWIISILGTVSLVIYLIWAKFDQLRTVTSTEVQFADPSSGAVTSAEAINSMPAAPAQAIDNIALNRLTGTPSVTSSATPPSVSANVSSQPPAPSSPTISESSPSAPLSSTGFATPDNTSSDDLVIKFTGTSWYEARDNQGTLLASGTENAGVIKQIKVHPPIKLTLGNAKETTVEFKGKEISLMPAENGVARLTIK